MRLAIISDTHDNLVTLKKALDWIKKERIKEIIHCGDLCAPSVLTKLLAPEFSGKIHLVHGNVGDPDLLEEVAKKFPNVTIYGWTGEVELDKKKIAFTHLLEKAKELAKTGKYDLVFYGHTHKPWGQKLKMKNEKLKIVRLVNPGTLAGMFYKATFAVYDTKTDKLELKILERL